jgi:spermidine synthase
MKPEVEHCTVIELSPDVIKLVEPHYKKIWGDRFEVINADAYEYQPPKGIKYDVVWDDIWDSICADNYEGIKKLKKKYARKTKWHGAWVEYRVKKLFANDY